MPLRSHSGMTSASGARHSAEYCGWLETNLATPGSPSAPPIPPAGPPLKADPARLAGLHDLGQRLHRLLQRRLLVVAMALVEVDVVHPQALQRAVDLLVDLLAREPSVLVRHREVELGGDAEGVARVVGQDLAPRAL